MVLRLTDVPELEGIRTPILAPQFVEPISANGKQGKIGYQLTTRSVSLLLTRPLRALLTGSHPVGQ